MTWPEYWKHLQEEFAAFQKQVRIVDAAIRNADVELAALLAAEIEEAESSLVAEVGSHAQGLPD